MVLLSCSCQPDYAVILTGNSIPANTNELLFGENLVAELPHALKAADVPGRADVTANIANHGGLTSRMLARDSAGVDEAYQTDRPTVLLVYEGSNDLWYPMHLNTSNAGLYAYYNLK